ncbi:MULTISPECIES: LysR family transcriptional regulator [Pseudomonadota]|uniref:LysR family transcriptional regulator n=2 Tax=Pseudomonadota TaxID=1224 RepID=UPI000769C38E|nr:MULTISPECIES: LysR family transcriptional regulator [Pseudomonadota]MBI2748989.1 LysR family transcriptional regulator [Burkholderiales bacterium]
MKNPVSMLRSVNMNLLPILTELLRSANVTRAASRLNLTQSTVSGSLRQLRDIFGDELLVQRGREMVLTERARRLVPEVERIMELAGRLFQIEQFDPLTAETRFRIATADYVSALVTSRLGATLQAQAPNVTLTLTPTPGTSAKELQQGSLDLIICPNLPSNWQACGISRDDPDFQHEIFMEDDLVAIQWKGHACCGTALKQNEYLDRPHAMYCRTDGHDTIEQEALTRLGLRQRTQFQVPYFTLLPQLVVGTDIIGLVPRSLALHYVQIFEIDIFKPPFELPTMNLVMIWARSRDEFPDLTWLRQMVRQASCAGATTGFSRNI